MNTQHPCIRRVSDCFIKPQYLCEEAEQPPYYLRHWDLKLLSIQYIQKGLLFRKPHEASISIQCMVALKLHEAVVNHTNQKLRKEVHKWFECPSTRVLDLQFLPYRCMMTSSPRFDIYGNEFGMGKPVAIRSGCANKFDGMVTAYPGYEGGGSVDLEIALLPHNMANLESDSEFMKLVSSPSYLLLS